MVYISSKSTKLLYQNVRGPNTSKALHKSKRTDRTERLSYKFFLYKKHVEKENRQFLYSTEIRIGVP